jgi:2-polyprenyl-3-methyl-5-hydroxy-6-metoxy-1,4-benzoquinol methylase
VAEGENDQTDLVRRGYDALTFRYRTDDAEPQHHGRWVERLLSELDPHCRVLDVGCGCGIPVARALAAGGHAVTGIDISDRQIERARLLVPNGTFIQADITQYQLPPRSFEAVVALYSIIHVPLSRQESLLSALADSLVDDGLLLLTAGWETWTGSDRTWLGGTTEMWWSHADNATYRRWLGLAGFEIIENTFVPEGPSGHSLFWARRR